MHAREIRRIVYAATAMLVIAPAVSWWWATSPLPTIVPFGDSAALGEIAIAKRSPVPDVDAAMALRRPLVDPPAKPKLAADPSPPPTPKPKAKPKPNLTLVMTVNGPAGAVAVVSDASGKTDTKGVGEKLALRPSGAIIRAIESDTVTIDVRGQISKLKIERRDYSSAKPATGAKPSSRPRPSINRSRRIQAFPSSRGS